VRLVSWNVNSLKARSPRVLELLHQHAPDVVCVQETKCAAAAFPHAELAAAGYRAVDHSCGRWNGVALLVREGLDATDVQLGLPGEPDASEARWVEATVDGLRVASVYVVNGRTPEDPMFGVKLHFLEAMRDRIEELLVDGPVVVAGDLNVAPEDRDVWDPAVFEGGTHTHPEERQRLAAILDLGLRDAFRVAEPDVQGFTFWDYRMGAFRRGMGMRIDAILASRDLEVRRCEVDTSFRRNNAAGDKPSDHAPLVAELERSTTAPRPAARSTTATRPTGSRGAT
jgi:exodeoxyribonuclease III